MAVKLAKHIKYSFITVTYKNTLIKALDQAAGGLGQEIKRH